MQLKHTPHHLAQELRNSKVHYATLARNVSRRAAYEYTDTEARYILRGLPGDTPAARQFLAAWIAGDKPGTREGTIVVLYWHAAGGPPAS